MGSGGGQTQTTNQSIPEEFKPFAGDLLNFSSGITRRDYEPYPHQRIADTPRDTLTGYDAIRSMSGVGQPEMRDLIGVGREVAGYQAPMVNGPAIGDMPMVNAGTLAGTDLSAYLNPWTTEVTNRGVDEIMRAGGMANSAARTGAAGAYASGSARAALLEAETNRNALDRAGSLAATTGMQGFTNAQNAAMGDLNRDMQAQLANQGVIWDRASQNASMDLQAQLANQNAMAQAQGIRLAGAGLIGDSVSRARQFGFEDAGRLMGIGGAQEAKEQGALDLAYQDYLRQFGYPVDQLGIGVNALSGLLGGQGTRTSSAEVDNSGQLLSTGIGAVATIAAAYL